MNNEKQDLSPKELYDLKKESKNADKKKDRIKEKVSEAPKKVGKYVLNIAIVIGVIGGIVWLFSLIPNSPPTSAQNHNELSPPSHIVTTPLSDPIQRHMLEHADGDGNNGSGIIIQYNCDDYECEPDLIDKLTAIVEDFPRNVYLAPNNYDGKIILTKLGRSKTLDEFDEQEIRDFIK